jgi:hypothetical protein
MSLMPKDQGLYESRREHDACGIGAVPETVQAFFARFLMSSLSRKQTKQGSIFLNRVLMELGWCLVQRTSNFVKNVTHYWKKQSLIME